MTYYAKEAVMTEFIENDTDVLGQYPVSYKNTDYVKKVEYNLRLILTVPPRYL